MTTYPDLFKRIHLDRCASTNDYIKENLPRLAKDLPLMVSASVQSGGRGRDGRGWVSREKLGIYATFAFLLSDRRGLSFLSIASGIAVAEMLQHWTGRDFVLKWPNDILAEGKKIAGVLCENIVAAEKITCLVGVGINVNHEAGDFPGELCGRAGSLKQLTGAEWPLEAGCTRLAASMGAWMQKILNTSPRAILKQARRLTDSFLGREISFHHQGTVWRGTFCGLAPDGGLMLKADGQKEKIFYSGEIVD